MRAVLPVAKQNTSSAGMLARLDSSAIIRRMPSGCTPEPAGPSVPRITRCGHLSSQRRLRRRDRDASRCRCARSRSRAHCVRTARTRALPGSAVWPPLMWPMMSASASSTTSLSIRPEPGMRGPASVDGALDAVLARPGHHLLCLGTGLDRAEADLAEQRDAGLRELREVALDHALLDHRRAGRAP